MRDGTFGRITMAVLISILRRTPIMNVEAKVEVNVKQAVPFFEVSDMERSLRYYLDSLGFALKHKWTPEGKIRWCWLEIGDAALMLQEYWPQTNVPREKRGVGVSICFTCRDALAIYGEFKARGIDAKRPFVGNSMWVT